MPGYSDIVEQQADWYGSLHGVETDNPPLLGRQEEELRTYWRAQTEEVLEHADEHNKFDWRLMAMSAKTILSGWQTRDPDKLIPVKSADIVWRDLRRIAKEFDKVEGINPSAWSEDYPSGQFLPGKKTQLPTWLVLAALYFITKR